MSPDKLLFCTKKIVVPDNKQQTVNASFVIHCHTINHNENSSDIVQVQ